MQKVVEFLQKNPVQYLATVIVKFKKLSKLENSRLKFCINGEDKYIDIPTDMN